MAIIVKQKKVSEVITDENGKELGIVSFNPDDLNVYNEFMDLANIIEKGYQKDKKIGVPNISNKEIKSIDEFENEKKEFEKISKKLANYDEMYVKIKEKIDNIFGSGTFDILTDGANDIELVYPIIDWAAPFFKKSRKIKVDKYLEDESDVM